MYVGMFAINTVAKIKFKKGLMKNSTALANTAIRRFL